jgi:hypothetical protein
VTLFIDRIEIRQQPELKRYFIEVEARVDAGQRHKFIPVPYADGRDGMLRALAAYFDEIDPPPKKRRLGEPDGWVPHTMTQPEAERILEGAAEIERAPSNRWPDVLPELRAEAAARGVVVDNRWGEVRLRQEIASVGQREPADD